MEWDDVEDGDTIVVELGEIEMRGDVTVNEEEDSFVYEIPVSHEELPEVEAVHVPEDGGLVALYEGDSTKYTTEEDFEFRRPASSSQ